MLNELLIKELSEQVGINTSDIQVIKDGEIYSTSEIKTNKKWIDGKPIYRKVVNITSQSQNHNIDSLDTITYFKALVYIDNLYGKCDVSNDISVQSSIIWLEGSALANVSNTISLVVEYTKTTD